MNGGRAKTPDVMQKMGLWVVGDVVRFDEAEPAINGDVRFGSERMPDPADAQLTDLVNAVNAHDGGGCFCNESGVHGVHQSCPNLPDG